MYRIKLASGDETTYTSIDELTSAVQTGVVGVGALIYHQRADRWLSVTNHPHYQIALSRAQVPNTSTKSELSRRQVISAVRPPDGSAPNAPQPVKTPLVESNVPPTVAREQLMEVVAEMDKGHEASKAARRLTIPVPRKPEPTLRAQENVLEGVVIAKPTPAPSNGRTTALPTRGSGPAAAPKPAASTRAASPRVPDLGDGLDLIEVEPAPVASATPQVDKLMSLLQPQAPAELKAPKQTPVHASRPAEVELIDLNKPLPLPLPVREVATAAAHHETPSAEHATARVKHHSRRSSDRKFPIVAAAAVVLIGAVLAIWRPWSASGAQTSDLLNVASTGVPRTEAFGGLSTAANPAPTTSTSTLARPSGADSSAARSATAADSAPSIVRVVAPRLVMNAPLPTANLVGTISQPTGPKVAPAELTRNYAAAYGEARSEMELRMLQIGFTQVFLRSRLSTSSGVQDTRRLIASAESAIRGYRGQESRIERAYQDTLGPSGRNLGWNSRELGMWNVKPSQRETQETMRMTNLFLAQMDSVLSLLAAQEGKYQVSGESIVFDNADAAGRYGALRGWLNQQADHYSGSGDAALPPTLRQVIKAIGPTRLPQERRK